MANGKFLHNGTRSINVPVSVLELADAEADVLASAYEVVRVEASLIAAKEYETRKRMELSRIRQEIAKSVF